MESYAGRRRLRQLHPGGRGPGLHSVRRHTDDESPGKGGRLLSLYKRKERRRPDSRGPVPDPRCPGSSQRGRGGTPGDLCPEGGTHRHHHHRHLLKLLHPLDPGDHPEIPGKPPEHCLQGHRGGGGRPPRLDPGAPGGHWIPQPPGGTSFSVSAGHGR